MPDLKKKLLDLAIEATGDKEISVAGDFQPKGLTWKRATAAGAGSLIGSEVSGNNSLGTTIGAGGGYIVGQYAGTSGNIPPVVVLAASKSKLYVFTTNNAKGTVLAKSLVLLDTLDREDLVIETKQKITVRTLVIKDEKTGHEYALEGRRMTLHHMNDVIDTLAGDSDEA